MLSFDRWLNRPSYLLMKIEDATEEVERCRAICNRATTEYGENKVKTNNSGSRETSLLKLAEAQQRLDTLCGELFDTQAAMREFIYEHLPMKMASVLDWRYCHAFSREKTAEKLNMSYSGLCSASNRALSKLRKEYNEYMSE